MGFFKSLKGRDRPLCDVPLLVYVFFAIAFTAQLVFHGVQPRPVARAADLPHPPKTEFLQIASLGEPVTLSKVLMLWLQAFDYQSGISIRFMDLDPTLLSAWLGTILALDPDSNYPLVAASQMYADIPRKDTQLIMSEFVHKEFLKAPNKRWRAMGHIAILTKHSFKNLPLALKYAKSLAANATGPNVSAWAKQMQFIFLEDMGDLQAARAFINNLLSSGDVTSPQEINLLKERLYDLEQKLDK
ncbi:MAG: hypothetical protein HQL69_10050 [Magnetococcales bacterium]|nr:hypothetical protein [Magnetococcales bacterium]